MSAGCVTPQGQELDPTRMANADSSQQDNGMTLIAVLLVHPDAGHEAAGGQGVMQDLRSACARCTYDASVVCHLADTGGLHSHAW